MGCHFLSLWNLPGPGIEPGSPALQADSLLSELKIVNSMAIAHAVFAFKRHIFSNIEKINTNIDIKLLGHHSIHPVLWSRNDKVLVFRRM